MRVCSGLSPEKNASREEVETAVASASGVGLTPTLNIGLDLHCLHAYSSSHR
jgi:hypothetical protein